MNNPLKQFIALASGTAVKYLVIDALHNLCAVVRSFTAIGNDAACAVTWYRAAGDYSFGLLVNLAANGTTLRVPVDVAGGHVFKGETLTTSYLVMVPGTDGWQLLTVSNVADVSQAAYCDLTVGATGVALKAGQKVYIIRPTADVVASLPAIGSATVGPYYNVFASDPGCPVICKVVATSAKATTVSLLVGYGEAGQV